jgi:hypothetical protein
VGNCLTEPYKMPTLFDLWRIARLLGNSVTSQENNSLLAESGDLDFSIIDFS